MGKETYGDRKEEEERKRVRIGLRISFQGKALSEFRPILEFLTHQDSSTVLGMQK